MALLCRGCHDKRLNILEDNLIQYFKIEKSLNLVN
jgi:hypothetical protein